MPKLALLQMRVQGGQKETNLQRAEQMIAAAALAKPDIILLPEAMPLGWTDPSAASASGEIPDGEFCQRLRQAARQHNAYLCSGIIERDRQNVFNSAVLIDPQGAVLLHHRKLNELKIAHSLYGLGDRLQVASTPWGRVGLMICADGFAQGQVISRTLGYMGAGLILSPCAWAVPHDHDNAETPYGSLWVENYCPVARDFQLWIASVSNVGWIENGPWQGRKCIGNSMVINPHGQIALLGPHGVDAETILYIDAAIPDRPAQGDEWTGHSPDD